MSSNPKNPLNNGLNNCLNNDVLSNAVRLLCALVFPILGVIGITVYKISASDFLLAFSFFFFYVQFPGLYLLKRAGLGQKHISVTLAVSLFIGWGFEVLVYFINDVLPTDFLLYISGPILSCLYCLELIRSKDNPLKRRGFRFSRLSPLLCLFVTLVMLYCALNVQFRYLSPEIAKLTMMNSDKAYHLGLINALSHDYPMISPWVAGRVINYHIFTEILLSIPVRLFGMTSDFMMLSFGPFLTTYAFCISVYSFFKEMSSVPKRAGAYSLLLLLSNIYITRDESTSLALKFALENDNSAGYGIAASLVSIVVFKKWYESFEAKASNRWSYLCLLILMLMLTTGIKGPMGAVIIASSWGTFMLGMILGKISPKLLAPMLPLTASFLLVYMGVLRGKGVSNASGESIFAVAKIVDIAFWKKPLVEGLKAIGMGAAPRLAVVLLVFMVFFFTIYFVPFCVGYIRELILVVFGRKEFNPPRVLVYAASAVGFVLLMIMNYSGHSQVYFGLVTAFLSPIVAFWFIEDLEAKRDRSKAAKFALNATLALMAVCLIATTISITNYMGRSYRGAVKASNAKAKHNKYLSISDDEYEAMRWLMENTDEDALLATDRYYSVPLDEYDVDNRWDNRFFLYAVYSNRFTYISGSGYNIPDRESELRLEMIKTNRQLYDVENEQRGDLARELGVDYVVVSKRFTKAPDLANKDYKLCYTNKDIDIYKIAG
ncbi:MAG: hypothetical protein IKE52_05555 [Mogibacterium sp.]|nr:hypothetical protein [Mogibacterium sp.]